MNSRTLSGRRHLAPLLTLLVVGIGLSACSSAEETTRDESGAIAEANENASVFEMEIGDCYDVPSETEAVETLPAIPCGDPHDLEVYHEIVLDDGDYPGEAAVTAQGDEACIGEFATFVGLDFESSRLDYLSFYPTAESWEQGDRVVSCLVGDQTTKTTGSLAGIAE
ncbi:septum formation family protein [Aeromicrobium marinum]|uniref:septum formation family protein n=1 Tax=Aeromicrobium marinum TaxID=219314 RepID=UPI00067FED30|nr:septum formation family protein [Aeromicrobium marinum]